ncbi:unnamed protein product [Absidia cylindrospora]
MYSNRWHQSFDPHLQEEKVRDARARRLESSRLRIALFKALQVDSYTERQASLEKIIQVVKSYMRTAKTAFSPIKNTSLSKSTAGETSHQHSDQDKATNSINLSLANDTTEAPNGVTTNTSTVPQTYDDIPAPMTCLEIGGPDEELQYFLLTMLRLSYTCPFRDVRLAFQQFLKTTLDTGIIPTPQPRQLSPSYFIPLQDIFSLESTSSVQNVISYPRPSNLSFSPWSHDAASDCGASDSLDLNKPSHIQHTSHHIQHNRRQQHQHHRHSQSRLTPVASSFSSSTSSLLKPNSFGDPSVSSSSDHGDDMEHNDDSDHDDDDDDDDDNSDADASSMDDGAYKSHPFTTRGKCTGGRPSDEYVRQMLVKSFLDEGRLTNVYRIMSFFPTFYEIFQITMADITKASIGPLHRTWRTYLGIMASAEQNCQYLVSTLKLDFLQNGGDPVWLKGVNHCPAKLQRISGFLTKMARKPWRLTEDDILELMTVSNSGARTGSTPSLNMTWSKGELVQAILVISTFLGLSNFVLSCAVAPELDMYGGYYVHGYDSCCGVENELDDDMQHHRQRKQPRHHQHLSKEDELAIRAASSATGWYDSQISPKSSKNSEDEDDDDDEDGGGSDTENRPSQQEQSFQSDKGAGLGVSLFDSDEDDNNSFMMDGKHNSLYLNRTTALISQLKSSKDVLNDELHQSLANLNLFSNSSNKNEVTQTHQGKDDLGNTAATDNNDTIETPEKQLQQGNMKVNAVYEDLARFNENVKASESFYEEFEAGHAEYGEFMLSEYCWEDHGCDLVNHFMPGIGDELDDEFIEALSITDWSIFHQVADGTVDTSPLRNAIFFYVQQLLGVTKEDYDYEDIPKYLSEQTQHYIQKVCRQPHLLDRNDWNNVGISLRSEEKCHMNLLIASARKQALLCYGLSLVSHV